MNDEVKGNSPKTPMIQTLTRAKCRPSPSTQQLINSFFVFAHTHPAKWRSTSTWRLFAQAGRTGSSIGMWARQWLAGLWENSAMWGSRAPRWTPTSRQVSRRQARRPAAATVKSAKVNAPFRPRSTRVHSARSEWTRPRPSSSAYWQPGRGSAPGIWRWWRRRPSAASCWTATARSRQTRQRMWRSCSTT